MNEAVMLKCQVCGFKHDPTVTFSYDGRGINLCDPFRSRLVTFGHVDRELQDRMGPLFANVLRLRDAIDIQADAIQMFIEDGKPPSIEILKIWQGRILKALMEADPVYYQTYFGTERGYQLEKQDNAGGTD